MAWRQKEEHAQGQAREVDRTGRCWQNRGCRDQGDSMPAQVSLPPTDLSPEDVARRLRRPSIRKAKPFKFRKDQTAKPHRAASDQIQ